MNKDLEATLADLGPGYREMVLRLKAPFGAVAGDGRKGRDDARWRHTVAFLVAASLTLALAVAAVFLPSFAPRPSAASIVLSVASAPAVYTVAYGGRGSVEELVRTQRADGSWGNDFLTRQNAAALKGVSDASVAYRRAMRYLRSRGLEPLTEEELRRRLERAASFRRRG